MDLALPCCMSEEAKVQRRVNEEIDKQLNREKSEVSRETKFLLLGPEKAGKTTFLKQMRIINGCGYEEDRCEHVRSVFQNLLGAMQRIIRAMDLLGIVYRNPANAESAMVISAVRIEDISTALPSHVADSLRRLWDDGGVQECFRRRDEYGLPEETVHFLSNVRRVTRPGYIPSQEDYLCIRAPTRGICQYSFNMDNEFPIRIVDVGEQKSEPKKWIHCFEDVSGVIFMMALSEYDNPEGMDECIELFRTIVKSPWFIESHLLLLLNKKDLFEDKIAHGLPLGAFYPAYHGPPNDAKASREFIRRLFAQIDPERPVYFFFTCATDTDDIKYVLPTVREIARVKTGVRSREPSDAGSNVSAMAAVAAAMNGVAAGPSLGSPGSLTTAPVVTPLQPIPPSPLSPAS